MKVKAEFQGVSLPWMARFLIACLAVLSKLIFLNVAWSLGGCSSTPPAPQWQQDVTDSLRRAQTYVLEGRQTTAKQSLAEAEIRRLREFVSAGADPALRARVELALCAAQAAALDAAAHSCEGFERWASSADPASRAYASYLRGRAAEADLTLLPPQHHQAARAIAAGQLTAEQARELVDPMARLIAISAAFVAQSAPPETIALAAQTAAEQGWRKSALSWLGVQLKLAQVAGDTPTQLQIQQKIQAATR